MRTYNKLYVYFLQHLQKNLVTQQLPLEVTLTLGAVLLAPKPDQIGRLMGNNTHQYIYRQDISTYQERG